MSIVRAVLGTRPPAVQAAFKEVFAQPANRTCVDCGRALVVTSPTAVYIARDLGVTLCAACAAIHADTSALDGGSRECVLPRCMLRCGLRKGTSAVDYHCAKSFLAQTQFPASWDKCCDGGVCRTVCRQTS